MVPNWLDKVFEVLPFSAGTSALMLASAVFILGGLIAASVNFGHKYFSTLPVYLGFAGIALTAGVIRFASRQVHGAYAELRPCFLVEDVEYRELIVRWLRRIWSGPGNIAVAASLFSIGAAAVWVSFYAPQHLSRINLRSFRPVAFGPEWFDGTGVHAKASIVLVFGLVVAVLLGSAARMLVVNFLFLLDLRRLPVIPAANVIRSRLRAITNFYMIVTFAWFVGVGLFGVVFLDVFDPLSVGFLVTLSLIGTATFLTPQVVFRSYLASSYRLACDVALLALNLQMGIELREEECVNALPQRFRFNLPKVSTLGEIMDVSARPFRLVYDAEDVLVILFGQGVTVGVFVLQFLVERGVLF
jgi:hypothetical protein